jgi:hypothetical protein
MGYEMAGTIRLSRKYLLLVTLGIPLGILAIVAGEADDSPGLQGLGLFLLIAIFIQSLKKLRAAKGSFRDSQGL